MTEDPTAEASDSNGEPVSPAVDVDAGSRPPFVPEKFWDSETNSVRTEALAKSYAELERRFGSRGDVGIPDTPDGYTIETESELIAIDPDVNAKLHEAGFTGAQAQLVYDLAAERLMPMVGEIAGEFEAKRQTEKLVEHFGGPERWHDAKRQIAAWGRTSFAPEVFEALSTTAEGVIAMHAMMAADEPSLMQGDNRPTGDDETALRELMNDPRYWRHRESGIVRRVREGFRRLYPD